MQLLEEMLDHGYALTVEPNALKAMIPPPSIMGKLSGVMSGESGISDVLPDGTISSMPWRKTGVRYTQNEIYFDIEEEISGIVDAQGNMVSWEVGGVIKCNSRLSGVPDLTLVFADPTVIDDCSFHPCVRYSRYERDHVVSFVPPDGHFELMSYRVQIANQPIPPIYCEPRINFSGEKGTVSVMVGERTNPTIHMPPKAPMKVEDIAVKMALPASVNTADFEQNHGKTLYDQQQKIATWSLGTLPQGKAPQLTGKLFQANAEPGQVPAPVLLEFKVPNASISGIAVETLLITNERYKPYKGVKTMVKAGKLQFRVV